MQEALRKEQRYVLVSKHNIQNARDLLTKWNVFLKSVEFLRGNEYQDRVGVPITDDFDVSKLNSALKDTCSVVLIGRSQGAKKSRSVKHDIHEKIREVMMMNNLWTSGLENSLPNHWEKHSDLILLPENSLKGDAFSQSIEDITKIMCDNLKVKRVARKSRICSNDFRSPKVEFLTAFDNNTWAERIDNGIIYKWDITKSMFSAGNITEKLRISHFDCSNEVVVDLFAGIGYFSLPYLVKAKAKFLHACEWNPGAVDALRINMKINKVPCDKYAIHFGDNRKVCPEDVADRVNLGLIPSSECSWEAACRALKIKTGGVLHIHGNVDSSKYESTKEALNTWGAETKASIQTILGSRWVTKILHIENVKSYGPKIYHAVADLQCKPNYK
ncbi:tRNA wybutosine-synthesizing protein 2 homolog [Lepeophtheirus salmonis]|uniref:tRNA wybutosine-synthesizing protein 2 homolog n=1 Tax=Lepeophtheirus salmonis TaxID=72036 RepID=UPI00077F417B|nr:tRNA wybutosine-synthesizing protein 2 homolog [Lepeophtheirus salmonis]